MEVNPLVFETSASTDSAIWEYIETEEQSIVVYIILTTFIK